MSVQIDRVSPGVAVLRLDRPERRNAMDSRMLDALVAALSEHAADPELRVLVFSTTSTVATSVGADIGEQLSAEQGRARMQAFGRLYAALEAFPVPTICVCVGNVLGAGAELAAGCDLRVAGDNLELAWVGARLGIPVGPARLVPIVGSARAKELIFTGRTLSMQDALDLGLATHGVPAGQAEARALELADAIARQDPPGLRRIKALFRALDDSEQRVAHENAVLDDFQRSGPGLPQGPAA